MTFCAFLYSSKRCRGKHAEGVFGKKTTRNLCLDIQLSDKETNLGLTQWKAGVPDTQCCHIYRYTTQIWHIKLESAYVCYARFMLGLTPLSKSGLCGETGVKPMAKYEITTTGHSQNKQHKDRYISSGLFGVQYMC